MIRLIGIAAFALTVTGCGGTSDAPPVPATPQGEAPTTEAPAPKKPTAESVLETMEMKNFEMRFYETVAATAGGQAPTFHVRADAASAGAGEGWRLELPQATIYGEDDQNVQLTAKTGVFDETSETATLSGGVEAILSDMNMTIESINYDNRERVAYSESPVHLEGDAAKLNAQSIRLHPKDGTVELLEVSGHIRLGEIQ